jgi:hypothetical protein
MQLKEVLVVLWLAGQHPHGLNMTFDFFFRTMSKLGQGPKLCRCSSRNNIFESPRRHALCGNVKIDFSNAIGNTTPTGWAEGELAMRALPVHTGHGSSVS